MRLSVILILLVLIAICTAKSSKGKTQKVAKSKITKASDDKKNEKQHKDEKQHKISDKHKDSKKHKDSNKKHDTKDLKKDKKPLKTNDKVSNKTSAVEKKENSTKAILLKSPPSDCQNIINDYSDGKLLMYEYKIQMSRCIKKAKEDAEGTSDADVKSALLRPDDQPREDTDQAINVRPYNSDQNTATDDSEDDYQTDNSDFSEHNNDNDNDYGDDDDDDENYEHDEQAAKKMQVPATAGYQAPGMSVQANTMPAQQQAMPGQQGASYFPNTAQMPYGGAHAQNPVPEQSQAAFVPNPMNQYPANPVQPADPNMGMNAVAKTNIPESTQPQPPANQANAVFDQWRASSFGAVSADKKDQMPSAPVAPVNDQFADFMKLQSSSSSPAEASPASQQAAIPAVIQQRTDVPLQPNMFSVQPQIPNTAPAQGQAFYIQPEEHGDFPENP